MPKTPGKDERAEMVRTLLLVSQLGWRMIGSILAGFGIGLYLDHRFGTKGWFMVPFLLLGIAGGFWSCYRVIVRFFEDEVPDKKA